MANTDSFVDEVTEEVRRDRLFNLFKKWGWLAALIVIGIVGAAAWNEYRTATERAAAQNFGDSVIAALDNEDAAERIAALEAITSDDQGADALLEMMIAAEETAAEDPEAAAQRLRNLADMPDLLPRYRDLALLKAHLLAPPANEAEADAILAAIATPGRPYAALAREQQAIALISRGDITGGTDILRELERDAAATPGLQQRASQLIVAFEAGSSLIDEPIAEPELVVPDAVLPPEPDSAPEETEDQTGTAPGETTDDATAPAIGE